ncbi:electron transport complex protein, subunit G [Gottschalkia acidurici 9a]|uniref:Ion-translocating oxidoreductase complex subunit G n=1 Tax=Gottschalkia acidurici (strain ATCC 7906 / DSM 604 / BCRC 14475 / CIP 104303 / KCTC 5404 / NCIMB 10678 / 9a) TaxID=1128398 RepID=K0AVW2_GOTA9|nr:RnfABCDGE type electron transport complex subunit G [Gottschalkia acidurici]AFS78013.1 electron transport complex protein, subunit G [Gottschalkia acidurici 9a]
MNKIVKLGIILLIITSVAAGILSFLNEKTKVIIAKQQEEANNLARKEVLPNGKDFKELDKDKFNSAIEGTNLITEIYEGTDGSNVVGYTIKTTISGYSGPVVVMTGIGMEGKLEGVKIVSNTETPGLGANAATPEFQNQYKGKTTEENLAVVKVPPTGNQIQALTGATITTKAVTDSVNEAIVAYKNLSK